MMIIDAAEKRWLLIELLGDVHKKSSVKFDVRGDLIFRNVDLKLCDSHLCTQ